MVGGDRRIPSYGGDYRYAREDKGVEVQLLLFESFGGFGKGVREILQRAADVLQNKLTRAQYLDEVTWTTKSWLGLQKQRISVVLHTAIAEQIVNELACGGGGRARAHHGTRASSGNAWMRPPGCSPESKRVHTRVARRRTERTERT